MLLALLYILCEDYQKFVSNELEIIIHDNSETVDLISIICNEDFKFKLLRLYTCKE